jgi:hypothetical protein
MYAQGKKERARERATILDTSQVPEDLKIRVVDQSEIADAAAIRRSGRWYGWKNKLLRQASEYLRDDNAIEIETPAHAYALQLRKDLATISARLAVGLRITIRGHKVYIVRASH